MGFSLNFKKLYEIDITPTGASRTYVRLGKGISSAVMANNDNVDQATYIDDDGFGTSTVIGMQSTIAFSGHRYTGDAAQDFIESIRHELGRSRDTNLKYTDEVGNLTSGECTICNVEFGGGEAAGKEEIAFEVHFKGKPTKTPKSIATALTATVAAGTVLGTTKFTATAGTGNTLAYRLSSVTSGTIYNQQYTSGLTTYTSEADIVATVGQFLQMYELDANERVVKYLEHQLVTADVNSGT